MKRETGAVHSIRTARVARRLVDSRPHLPFQAENPTTRWIAVLLIVVPIIIHVYFNSGLAYMLMKALKVEHSVSLAGSPHWGEQLL